MIEYSLNSLICNDQINVDLNSIEKAFDSTSGRLSNLNFLEHSARFHREIRPTNPQKIATSLRTLAAFSRFMSESEVKWYLTGGIAIDLINRSAFREHGDVDIVIPLDQLPRFTEYLSSRRVLSYRRVFTTKVYADRRFTVFKRVVPKISHFGHRSNLKLLLSPQYDLLRLIDIHLVQTSSQGTKLLCGKNIVTLPFQLAESEAFRVNGQRISCCDLRFILFLKSDDNPRNFKDAARVASRLPGEQVEHVLKLRHAFDQSKSRRRRFGNPWLEALTLTDKCRTVDQIIQNIPGKHKHQADKISHYNLG